MPMHCSITLHDYRPDQIDSHPILIDTEVFRAEDQFSVRFGEMSLITTRDRLIELRDKITVALASSIVKEQDVEPEPVAEESDQPEQYCSHCGGMSPCPKCDAMEDKGTRESEMESEERGK